MGVPVVVTGEKSPGLIAAMIAVMAEGAVLVPIDPDINRERRERLLSRVGLPIYIFAGPNRPTNLDGAIWIDNAGAIVELGVRCSCSSISDDPDAAYVIFTSGSTGTPKAILGSHRGLSHFLGWQRETFGVGPSDSTYQLTSISFDVMLRDIFLPLTSGGSIILPENEDSFEGAQVVEALRSNGVTILHTVPTLARSWLQDLKKFGERPSTLRLAFFAGEPLLADLLHAWHSFFGPQVEIVNLYGPTETTLAVCFHKAVVPAVSRVCSLGRPISGVDVFVLDTAGRPVGFGETGEIVIRSPYRSLGYLGLVEDGFQPNHLMPNTPETDRLYWTGDLGLKRPDQTLEYLGRKDDQVKVRGVRVDLNEVAEATLRHPGVAGCVVVERENKSGEAVIVGYLVPRVDSAMSHTSVRDLLRRSLPEAAVPTAFVTLAALPTLASGKVDRNALPAPSSARPAEMAAFVAPQTELEIHMCQIWQDLLGFDEIGVTDNFFELGGHSLLATRLVGRMSELLDRQVSLRVLFDHPSPKEIVTWHESETTGVVGSQAGSSGEDLERAYKALSSLPEDVRNKLLGNL